MIRTILSTCLIFGCLTSAQARPETRIEKELREEAMKMISPLLSGHQVNKDIFCKKHSGLRRNSGIRCR